MNFKFLSPLALLLAIQGAAQAQERAATDLTNIAAAANGGRVLDSTSTLDDNAAYSAKNLIDGQVYNSTRRDGSRGWASNKFDPITQDTVTFGFAGNRLYRIGRLVLNPTTDLTPERWAKDVEVQVSTESAEGPYSPVAQITLRQIAQPQSFDLLPVQARFVRLAFRSNFGSDRATGLGEVEIYESIDNSDAMGSVISRLENTISELRRYQNEVANAPSAPTTTARNSRAPQIRRVQLGGAAAPVTGRVNIALAKNGGRIAAFSSFYTQDAKYGPEKLIDGQVWSELDGKGSFGWASEGFAPNREYITLGFGGANRLIGRVVLNPASNQSDLRWARRIEMQATSGDAKNGPWKTVSILNLKTQATNQEFSIRPTEAKFLRFIFQANGPGVILPDSDPNINSDRAVSLGEIEVYEAPSGDDQLSALIGRFNNVLVDLKTIRRRGLDGTNGEVAPVNLKNRKPARAIPASTKPKSKPKAKVIVAKKPFVARALKPAKKTIVAKPIVTPLRLSSVVSTRISPPKSVREAGVLSVRRAG